MRRLGRALLQQSEQFGAADLIRHTIWRGQFQRIVLPVAAPVDDVVAALAADLFGQTGAGDAVGQKVRHHLALWRDLITKQRLQRAPLLAQGERE